MSPAESCLYQIAQAKSLHDFRMFELQLGRGFSGRDGSGIHEDSFMGSAVRLRERRERQPRGDGGRGSDNITRYRPLRTLVTASSIAPKLTSCCDPASIQVPANGSVSLRSSCVPLNGASPWPPPNSGA